MLEDISNDIIKFITHKLYLITITHFLLLIFFWTIAGFLLINSIFAAALKSNDSVAQLVEQYTFNVWVLGSSPSGITK